MHISNSNYSSFYSNYAKVTNQDSKSLQDFRLTNDKFTNTESEKIQISASQTQSLQTESLQTAMLSDEEILKRVRENVDFCNTAWREVMWVPNQYDIVLSRDIARNCATGYIPISVSDIQIQDLYFNEQIANKVKENLGEKITQEEMQEAQKFLNEQMDNLMLKLYKANPKMVEDTMKGEFIFHSEYSKSPRYKYEVLEDYPELEYDTKLSYILHAYGARIDADKPDDEYEKFLYRAKEYLSDTEKLKEIDEDTLKDTLFVIEHKGLAGYNRNKMAATGYEFFSALSDMLSPMEQEQIINAIAKVMGFYSQPNSIEINGIKISWEPQTDDFRFGMWSIISNVLFMNFEISYPQSNLFGNVSDNLLVSLTSNFNPTQSVLEILEQKDKQEQANQSLENQTSANTQANGDFGNQTLESRQAKKAYDDYKSNPLTPKASKEINDFVNEIIRKAKV